MYIAKENRYEKMTYNCCGRSGLKLPALSLGMWHNFGSVNDVENMKKILFTAFDNGITHFDLANNYGPVYGSAEANMGRILKSDLMPYRNEMIISSKAGYDMWKGPYGNGGSRKYLIASLDESLKRMGIDYVDIFYHHRPDPETPLEETMAALDQIVRSGKALYVGISNYNREQTSKAYEILQKQGTPFVIHQPRYSMLDRWIEEDGLKDFLFENGIGCIAFSPLAQGVLTGKYLTGIPKDSRIGSGKSPYLHEKDLDTEKLEKVRRLDEIAKERGQSLTQLALSWILRDGKVTSVLIGASRPEQILENIKALENTSYSEEELKKIDEILN
ncbi:MAG: L-glyceraldehyde 3-phosphate reductase [Suilimivivens sp.]|nr:L-glyceraldehyde 3-phosphate reductase [Lachnospiraceae bacterium]MDY5870756.1 L-glyceraldehyde 3-phosphate reductase [Lachnospiraceae bacterium]